MTALDLAAMQAAAVAAAAEAGRYIAERFGRLAAAVTVKKPGDYVSDVDLESEAMIRRRLAALAPGVAFFGEEGGGERAALGWVVDPLDGTANFLHGFPVVGVSIALVLDGAPVVAVVHAPMLGDTYTATSGGGAFRDGLRLSVSGRAARDSICATGFPFKAKGRLGQYRPVFDGAFDRFEDLRRAGAASLDLAWTAAGVFDGFFEVGLGTWDVAAGALLIQEAGGLVSDWSGDPAAWLASGDILAGTAAVHAELLGLAGGRKPENS